MKKIISQVYQKIFNSTKLYDSKITSFNWDNDDPNSNGEYSFLRRYAVDWKICLDIGANEGNYASMLLSINPKCRIICFEPNPTLIDKIKEKGINEVYDVAVGESLGSIGINFNLKESGMSSIYRNNIHCRTMNVNVICIDDFAAHR